MLLRDSPAAPVTEEALTESRELRQRYTDRTDVLDKVKALQLLPDDAHATTELVAAYYEVPINTIKKLVERNREELENNGYRSLTGADLATFASDIMSLANLGLSPKARSLAIFSRRAILNVGMLLRDSPIAQQVRTYLLDAEEAGRGRRRLDARCRCGMVETEHSRAHPAQGGDRGPRVRRQGP